MPTEPKVLKQPAVSTVTDPSPGQQLAQGQGGGGRAIGWSPKDWGSGRTARQRGTRRLCQTTTYGQCQPWRSLSEVMRAPLVCTREPVHGARLRRVHRSSVQPRMRPGFEPCSTGSATTVEEKVLCPSETVLQPVTRSDFPTQTWTPCVSERERAQGRGV